MQHIVFKNRDGSIGTIPVKAQQAEAARQAIRDKHAVIQTDIDAAETGDDLIQIIKSL